MVRFDFVWINPASRNHSCYCGHVHFEGATWYLVNEFLADMLIIELQLFLLAFLLEHLRKDLLVLFLHNVFYAFTKELVPTRLLFFVVAHYALCAILLVSGSFFIDKVLQLVDLIVEYFEVHTLRGLFL